MDKGKEIGSVQEDLRRFEWKIDDFPSLFEGDLTVEYSSPTFYASYNKWWMVLSLNDVEEGSFVVNLQLFRKTHLDEERVHIELGIVKADGTDLLLRTKTQTLTDGQLSLDKIVLARHSELESFEDDWMPSGALTIFWDIRSDYLDSGDEDDTDEGETLDEECCHSLRQDMLNMFEKDLDTDVTIRVSDSEFHAHQCILAVRSNLFRPILSGDMTKSSTRTVQISIDICEPSVLRQFLEFAYTGSVRSMTVNSAISLFTLAEQFESQDLMDRCSRYLEANMTTAVVCDVLRLKNLQEEERLESSVLRFFEDHATEILEGEAWMKFLKEDPERASEILENLDIPDCDKAPMSEIIRQEMMKEKALRVDLITEEYKGGKRILTKNINKVLYGRKNTDEEEYNDEEKALEKEYEEEYNDEEKALEKECCLSLRRDMLAMFEKGLDTDVTIRVRDTEFRAHQCILSVRSRYFHYNLYEDTTKEDIRTCTIGDDEPSVFRQFLEFAYTGSVRSMTVDSAVSLFSLADLYESPDLRARCSRYLEVNMTTAVVCDVLRLKNLDKEKSLLRSTMDFFEDHATEILESEEWMRFLEDEPKWANHIFENLHLPNYDKAPMREIIRQEMTKEIKPSVEWAGEISKNRNLPKYDKAPVLEMLRQLTAEGKKPFVVESIKVEYDREKRLTTVKIHTIIYRRKVIKKR